MSLLSIPPELKFLIFRNLADDCGSLRALVFVCRDVYNHTFEILRVCRTLTDRFEDLLIELGTRSVRSSRFNTLKVCFPNRKGLTNKAPIGEYNLDKLERIWERFASRGEHCGLRSWRSRMRQRFADTSVRPLLRTLNHITTLEIGGCTNVLPLYTGGALKRIRTLKFYRITNKRLAWVASCFPVSGTLKTLEFSHMSITGSFFDDILSDLLIATLSFKQCWVTPAAMHHIINHRLCRLKKLSVFEYTISTDYQPVEAVSSRHLHMYRPLNDLKVHADMLTELSLVVPELKPSGKKIGSYTDTPCDHVASLVQFPKLRKLAISYKMLAPHSDACNIDTNDLDQQDDAITAWSVLSRLGSLEELHLHCDKKMPVIHTLEEMANGIRPAVLPNLRRVEVVLPWDPDALVVETQGKEEMAVCQALKERGVDVNFSRPRP